MKIGILFVNVAIIVSRVLVTLGGGGVLCEGTHGYFPVACSFLLVYVEQKYHFIRRAGPHTMDGI